MSRRPRKKAPQEAVVPELVVELRPATPEELDELGALLALFVPEEASGDALGDEE